MPGGLPDDLPTSLDDRRSIPVFPQETEMYDAWQGQSQFLTTPVAAKPLSFSLALDDHAHDDEHNLQAQYGRGLAPPTDDDNESTITARLEDSDARLMEMLAAQAAHREVDSLGADEETIAADEKLSEAEKKDILQRSLNMAASNGDVDRVHKLLQGKANQYVDVNKPDEEGTVPLIYASCFGHQDVVSALLNAGSNVDQQDRNQWSALMWAMTNRHKTIAKILLDHGASPDIKSSSGGTAFDFAQPGSEISDYLHENGYNFGPEAVEDDFYDSGFAQGRFEEEFAENEMKRRMMMEESAINLEVDLSSLGLDEKFDSVDDEELEGEQQEFVWDRCLNDQMFVFQDHELERILDIIITRMSPQRSPSQKPVPANLLFLSARYAHYHASPELLAQLLVSATEKINDVVERHQWDMTILAFWMSNATLLLHYLKKDGGLVESTVEFQLHLAELINEIFILIIRDAERRMNKVLDAAMLDHETIPGLEDVAFQNEWKLFRSKNKSKAPEPAEKRFRPPSPRRRAQISPRNITSLLSSTLFVLDLYDVHSVITTQILSQLLYWLGAEIFNRIMTTKRYLARTKAMQIRMNVSTLEDWARINNRQPEHYENGSTSCTGESTMEAARRHLAPVIQLLQWLQCFSSLGDDFESLLTTLMQLQQLTPAQLLHAVKSYRPEVGEKGLSKPAMKFLIEYQRDPDLLLREQGKMQDAARQGTAVSAEAGQGTADGRPATPPQGQPAVGDPRPSTAPGTPEASGRTSTSIASPGSLRASSRPASFRLDDRSVANNVFLDPSLTLPFSLPTSTDMLISYGAGWGGTNRERARKYIPTVPPEVLSRFDRDG
ncbi:DIL and ankyrin domain protein [Aspergillus campestris IBT 28561]|uniref:DIL and ankyrin domain protein n=1 Tax=Aspergillus campestris (strain IBT 28561) TaxID=1392248 RepID=A0A2I1DFB2_ASPC2|nr:DIL and ankyrin domain protein [Aspergillus campestris IBT 28561]PKY08564.1 DIL and ankyrin domain protein [Aspergillus campestris IBT 28561]